MRNNTLLSIFAMLCLWACTPLVEIHPEPNTLTSQCRESIQPFTVTWKEFNAPPKLAPPRDIRRKGKIYVYDSLLLVNEIGKGVHLFQNANGADPKPLGFLPIVGNFDIAMRNGLLYVDSWMDLRILRFSNSDTIEEVARLPDQFPYRPELLLPENHVWCGYHNPSEDLIAGFTTSQGDTL